MATAIVSGRVDEAVKERAGAYIHAAGLTVGDVINRLWEYIAATGAIPELASKADTGIDQLENFFSLCDSISPLPGTEYLATMSSSEMKDLIAEHLEEKYA